MKKINIYLLTLLSVIALVWTACTDSVDYEPGQLTQGEGVYFSTTESANITLENTEGSFELNMYRTNTIGAVESKITIEYGEGASEVFSIPATISFTDGTEKAILNINYSNVVRGTKYQFTITANDGTPYGASSQTFTVIYPEDEGSWEVVSTEAVLIDNLFSMFGAKNIQISQITVEKNTEANQYRFRSPYDNSYFNMLFGMAPFSNEDNLPYIILDGEKFKSEAPGSYYIAQTSLGFQMVNGVAPKEDYEWNTFGSVAGNLSAGDSAIPPTSAQYPLGKYEETIKMFDLGSVYHRIGGDNGGFSVTSGFMLYLDPALMTEDYDRDYTWYDDYAASGTFKSTLNDKEEEWIQPVQYAAEDPTFYRFVSLYAPTTEQQKTHIYFNYDAEKNTLTLPKAQPTGLKTNVGGNEIYVSAVPGKSKVDTENGTFTFVLSFHLIDADGNTTAELAQVSETFLWGQGAYNLVKGKKLDDYLGNWSVPATDGKENLNFNVTLSKVMDQENNPHLVATGLSGGIEGYDDMVELSYDPSTGWILFGFQQAGNIQNGDNIYMTFAAPFDSKTMYLGSGASEVMIGGFDNDGNLQFLNNLTNSQEYDSMVYLLSPDGSQVGFLTGYWNVLSWNKISTNASFATMTKAINWGEEFGNIKSQQGKPVQRRVYQTTVNLQPVSIKSTYSLSTTEINYNNLSL